MIVDIEDAAYEVNMLHCILCLHNIEVDKNLQSNNTPYVAKVITALPKTISDVDRMTTKDYDA